MPPRTAPRRATGLPAGPAAAAASVPGHCRRGTRAGPRQRPPCRMGRTLPGSASLSSNDDLSAEALVRERIHVVPVGPRPDRDKPDVDRTCLVELDGVEAVRLYFPSVYDDLVDPALAEQFRREQLVFLQP